MSSSEAMQGGISSEDRIPMPSVSLRELTKEARESFQHAWPLVLGNLGQNMLGVVDTAMVGRLGAVDLAGVAIGNGLYWTFAVTAMGLLGGLDPIVSQAIGAKEGRRAEAALRLGFRLALLIAGPALLVIVATPLLLPLFGVSQGISRVATHFMWARALGVIPFIVHVPIRSMLQARGVTKPMLTSSIVANVVNLIGNVLLIYGDKSLVEIGLPGVGLPALGAVGSGIASNLAVVAQLLVLYRALRSLPPLAGEGDTNVPAKKVISLGWPISLTFLAELGAFTIAGIAAGRIGAEAGSGHQVAIQLASVTFTVSMAIATATGVRVGYAVGKRDMHAMRIAGWMGFGLSAAYMTVTSLVFLLFAEPLARIMTDRSEVIVVTVPLIHIAAAFQLFDGMQVVGAGTLRGLGDTRTTQIANLVGYYVVGVPVAWVLAFGLEMGARGLWWGLCAGLGTVALTLLVRWARLSRTEVART